MGASSPKTAWIATVGLAQACRNASIRGRQQNKEFAPARVVPRGLYANNGGRAGPETVQPHSTLTRIL